MSSLFVFCTCCLVFVIASAVPLFLPEDAEFLFERFIQEHNRHYVSEHEKLARFQIFKDNLERTNHMNQNSQHTVFGITRYMDLTPDEFLRMHSGLLITERHNIGAANCTIITDNDIPDEHAPDSFDWRDQNVVTSVKDQKSCGNCYAFSSIGNIEGQYAIKYKQQLSFSEQQIVDCDPYDRGCSGGVMTKVFRYLIETGGLELETDYPFIERDDKCTFDRSKVKVNVIDCFNYRLNSQEKLKQLLYKTGPISIGVSSYAFHTYHGGILLDKDCGNFVSHAVLLVGYGTSDTGVDYWIVKNSEGEKFGEKGYVRMQRGENATSCGMMNDFMASSVIA